MHSGVNGIKKHACNCGRVDGGWTGECCRSVLPSFHSPWYSSPLEQLKEPRVRVMGPAGTRQHNRNRHVKPGDFNTFYTSVKCAATAKVCKLPFQQLCVGCVLPSLHFLTVHHLECAGADTSPVCDKSPPPLPSSQVLLFIYLCVLVGKHPLQFFRLFPFSCLTS